MNTEEKSKRIEEIQELIDDSFDTIKEKMCEIIYMVNNKNELQHEVTKDVLGQALEKTYKKFPDLKKMMEEKYKDEEDAS